MSDLPAWLSPPPPPQAEGRVIKRLDPMPPEIEHSGLRKYQQAKRKEYVARIKASGLTETEYVRRQKAAARKRLRAK